MSQELSNTKRGTQNGQAVAHRVVLVGDQEKHAIDQNAPDGNVGQNSCGQRVCIDHDGTVPVESDESPGQRSRDDGQVDKAWVCWMAEVKGRQIEEVDNQEQLCPPEVRTYEEHDEAELEKVAEDEVGAHTRCSSDEIGVLGEQMPDVADLEDEEDNPVDGHNDAVHAEACVVVAILTPYTALVGMVIMRGVEDIVEGAEDNQEPREDSEDLVGNDLVLGMRFTLREGIDLRRG